MKFSIVYFGSVHASFLKILLRNMHQLWVSWASTGGQGGHILSWTFFVYSNVVYHILPSSLGNYRIFALPLPWKKSCVRPRLFGLTKTNSGAKNFCLSLMTAENVDVNFCHC